MRRSACLSPDQDVSRWLERTTAVHVSLGAQRQALPERQEVALDSLQRSPNGFLAALSESDFELIRQHLRTIDLAADSVLIEADEILRRVYMPHKGVISLV